VKYIIVELCFC